MLMGSRERRGRGEATSVDAESESDDYFEEKLLHIISLRAVEKIDIVD
jgi:hypothetical protein